MRKWRVIVSREVKRQIREQMLYIAEDSVDYALAWDDRLQDAIKRIGEVGLGHAVDEEASARLGFTVHKVTFERTYLIHYVVNGEAGTIDVINFRHGARLPHHGEP